MEPFRFHNLTTGTITHRVLLCPEESIESLETIIATWTAEFPGDAPALILLRHHLIQAHWCLLRAQTAFEEGTLQAHLVPLNTGSQLRLQYLQRQSSNAERQFTRNLSYLRSWRKEALTLELMRLRIQAARQSAAKSNPPPPPPEEPKPAGPVPLLQHVRVTIVDGVVSHFTYPSNEQALRIAGLTSKLNTQYRRTIQFSDAIPEQYRWPCFGDRDWNQPGQIFKFRYDPAEFAALARHEAEHPDTLFPDAPNE